MTIDPFVAEIMAHVRTSEELRAAVAHLDVSTCPFCGTVARLDRVIDDIWHVECTDYADCGAGGPIRDTPEAAAHAWNRRLIPQSRWEMTGL